MVVQNHFSKYIRSTAFIIGKSMIILMKKCRSVSMEKMKAKLSYDCQENFNLTVISLLSLSTIQHSRPQTYFEQLLIQHLQAQIIVLTYLDGKLVLKVAKKTMKNSMKISIAFFNLKITAEMVVKVMRRPQISSVPIAKVSWLMKLIAGKRRRIRLIRDQSSISRRLVLS